MKRVLVRATRPLPQLGMDEIGMLDYDGNVPQLIANGILELVTVATERVPQGTVRAVASWVGDDRERARLALDVESRSASPRASLLRKLRDVLGHEESSQDPEAPEEPAPLLGDPVDPEDY